MANTIRLKQYEQVYLELPVASGKTVSPGQLVEITSANAVQPHSAADGDVVPIFAVENDLVGKTITDSYSAGDTCLCYVFRAGDVVQAYLKKGENVTVGDFLSSAGDGSLKKFAGTSINEGGTDTVTVPGKPVVGIALEAKDLSAASEAELIKVMIV